MRRNIFVNFLTNFFVILAFLYLSTFVGVLLIILRIIVGKTKNDFIGYYMLGIGVLVLIPQLISYINIDYTENIINNELYIVLYESNNKIFIVGIILILVSIIKEKIINSVISKIRNYIRKENAENLEIKKENDLKIRLKQEKAKNSKTIICPYCGGDNIVSEPGSKCKYCRRILKDSKKRVTK